MARMLKESGVATLEKTLENGNDCMAMAMCKHGAIKAIAKEDAFYVAMKTFTAFLKSVQEASTRSTKHIDALTGALRVGSAMGEGACQTLYPCPDTDNQIQGRRGEVRVHFQLKLNFSIFELKLLSGVCVLRPLLPGIRSQLRDVRDLQPGSLRRSLSCRRTHLRLHRVHLQP